MTTRAEALPVVLEPEVFDEISQVPDGSPSPGWTPERFAREQIQGLVQGIFLSSQPACRQVAFSAVDQETDLGELCMQVGQALSRHLPKVCIVDCVKDKAYGGMAGEPIFGRAASGGLRASCRQLSPHLWMAGGEGIWNGPDEAATAEGLGRRLTQLRSEFDGCVIQAPPAGTSSTARLLGRLSDGLILVLAAHSTRRLAAQKAQAAIRAANVRLLGTVLSERTFPIPERLYRRL